MPLKLNKEQQVAAEFLNGICVVVAVPGSGKTLTMTHRIGNLVKKYGVAPENILGIIIYTKLRGSYARKTGSGA